jgi:hypothetical protein
VAPCSEEAVAEPIELGAGVGCLPGPNRLRPGLGRDVGPAQLELPPLVGRQGDYPGALERLASADVVPPRGQRQRQVALDGRIDPLQAGRALQEPDGAIEAARPFRPRDPLRDRDAVELGCPKVQQDPSQGA